MLGSNSNKPKTLVIDLILKTGTSINLIFECVYGLEMTSIVLFFDNGATMVTSSKCEFHNSISLIYGA